MNRPYSGQVRLNADRLLGLAGGGVYPADDVTAVAVRSYRTISPLPVPRRAIGRVFSVALSLGYRAPILPDSAKWEPAPGGR